MQDVCEWRTGAGLNVLGKPCVGVCSMRLCYVWIIYLESDQCWVQCCDTIYGQKCSRQFLIVGNSLTDQIRSLRFEFPVFVVFHQLPAICMIYRNKKELASFISHLKFHKHKQTIYRFKATLGMIYIHIAHVMSLNHNVELQNPVLSNWAAAESPYVIKWNLGCVLFTSKCSLFFPFCIFLCELETDLQ